MNQCSSSHCNQFGSCSCGLFRNTTSYSSSNNSFSMLFPGATADPNYNYDHEVVLDNQYPYSSSFTSSSSSSSSSSVDCTLSLGTPSTRHNHQKHTSGGKSCIWNIFQTKQPPASAAPAPTHHHKNGGGGGGAGGGGRGGGNASNSMIGDPLLARRCANCDTTSTPLWRNGPRGPKSLCNACGIRYKKEERRATSTTTTNSGATGAGSTVIDPQYLMGHQYSWAHHHQQTTHHHLGNEFMFVEDDDHRDSDNGIPFLTWRLNVPERSGLVHDYTC